MRVLSNKIVKERIQKTIKHKEPKKGRDSEKEDRLKEREGRNHRSHKTHKCGRAAVHNYVP